MGCTQAKTKPPMTGQLDKNKGQAAPGTQNKYQSGLQNQNNQNKVASGISGNNSNQKYPSLNPAGNPLSKVSQNAQPQPNYLNPTNTNYSYNFDNKPPSNIADSYQPVPQVHASEVNKFNNFGTGDVKIPSKINNSNHQHYGLSDSNLKKASNIAGSNFHQQSKLHQSNFQQGSGIHVDGSNIKNSNDKIQAKRSNLREDEGQVPQDSIMDFGQTTIPDPSKIQVHFHV